jgi:hypothetical protein
MLAAAENSEVLLLASNAVALTLATFAGRGNVTLKRALPELSVVTRAWPSKTRPSPNPEPSAAGFATNSNLKLLDATEWRLP